MYLHSRTFQLAVTKCTAVCACFPRIHAQKALDAEVAIREGRNSSCTKIYLLFPLRRSYWPNTKNLKTNITVHHKSMQHALGHPYLTSCSKVVEGGRDVCDDIWRKGNGGVKYHVTKVLIFPPPLQCHHLFLWTSWFSLLVVAIV